MQMSKPYCPNCGSEEHTFCEITARGTWPNPKPDVDELLHNLGSKIALSSFTENNKLYVYEAKAALLELSLGCLPDRIVLNEQFTLLFYGVEALQEYRSDHDLLTINVRQAVDHVLDLMEHNLREVFNGK